MTPFVLVTAIGGCKPTHDNPPGPTGNPPAPDKMSITECQAVRPGADCAYEYGECSVGPDNIDCGLQGYDCKETAPGKFTWTEIKFACDTVATKPE